MPGTVKWVVNPTAGLGTHTTIQAAITAAASGDNVFITPGTYTENITLKAGVNLVAWTGDASLTTATAASTVKITGKLSFSSAGTVNISGIQLNTNNDNFLAVTGSAASIVNLNNCYLNCSNNTGISYTSSSSSAKIYLNSCFGNIGTTGITLVVSTSAGEFVGRNVAMTNTGSSSTPSTTSSGGMLFYNSVLTFPLSSSSTGAFSCGYTYFVTVGNVTNITTAGTGSTNFQYCYFSSGSASAISIGSGTTVDLIDCIIVSSNTSAVTGAGTVNYSPIAFPVGSSSNINTTTQVLLAYGPSAKIGSSNSGNTNTLTLTNSSNTATSSAAIATSVGGSTAADPVYQSIVTGVTTWTWGIDNSVTTPTADPFVISQGTSLGTNNVMSVATSGEINYPLQPAFLAFSTLQSNVTGDGTAYTVTFDTEVFDQNSDFASPNFTAPVTGRYELNVCVAMTSTGAGITEGVVTIVTSNRTYSGTVCNPNNVKGASSTILNFTVVVLADMDAADTANVVITMSNGTKVADVSTTSWFSGNLQC